MLKKLNSEQLHAAIDENPTCTTRELSKTFNVSRHMIIYREVTRFKGWEIDPHTICQKLTSNSV
ncbi:unnamed protein product [Hymenolepis diminuta]|uniref:HTH psq-type domain-containing protein n=1 Tax=Hymenolepis diminuta TaxID=6216 RepID=A0A564YEX7_HYMDI|nr:unnamed protein product [Hymenolepis diminuta]